MRKSSRRRSTITLYELKSILRYTKADLPVTAYAGDRLVGVAVAYSDYSSLAKAINGRLFPVGWVARIFHKIRTARCSMVFVAPDFHNKAVNAAMMLKMVQRAKAIGIQAFEISRYRRNQPAKRAVAGTRRCEALPNVSAIPDEDLIAIKKSLDGKPSRLFYVRHQFVGAPHFRHGRSEL